MKVHKLPKKFIKKWLTALRSGKYEQGKGYLKNTDEKYCCLGVACLVGGLTPDEIGGKCIISAMSLFDEIPKKLRSGNALSGWLVEMNDIQGKSFLEIADWVETNVEVY